MIWLLLIFIPGGLNQDISTDVPYRIIHPCDDTSISAVIQSPVQRHLDQYDLLIPIPIWGDDLILTFDSEVILKLINPGRTINIINDLHSTQDFHLAFFNGTEQLLNCTILKPLNSSTIPYVQSIRLNQDHQLCNHPKTGYFYDVESPKRMVLRDIASSTMSNAENSGDPHKRSIRDTAFELAADDRFKSLLSKFGSSASNDDSDDFFKSSLSSFKSSASNGGTDDFFTPSQTFYTFKTSASNGNTDDFLTPSRSISTFKSITSSGNTDDDFKSLLSRFRNSASNGNTDDFFPSSLSTFKSSASNGNTEDFFKSSPSTFRIKASEEKDTTTPSPPPPKIASSRITISLDESCGIQKVLHTPLIVNGQSSYSGQWPWHVALFRVAQQSLKYICGGTLLSKTLVLTAGHCATISGSAVVPETLRVRLGSYDLFSGDPTTQEKEVFRVIVYPKYDSLTQDNDIALLKLKSEVDFTDYARPACLWYERASSKLPLRLIFGTIAGWGLDEQDLTSHTLRHTTAPLIPELDCLKSNPTFFHKVLNTNKFCGGFANGTAACNGDSGGGFMIFVPDAPGTTSGAWFVRGIVSISVRRKDKPICDPYEYTVFTDVEKYRSWLLQYME